jgi:hypothetical protein
VLAALLWAIYQASQHHCHGRTERGQYRHSRSTQSYHLLYVSYTVDQGQTNAGGL